MKKHLLRMMFAVMAVLFSANVSAVTETYDFLALLNGGYTTINSSGTKSFEGKELNVISSFTNSSGDVGANVGGRIAALYQGGNESNFWFRDASRPWFVSAGKTSYMAFDNLKAGDVVKLIGGLSPITILCDNVLDKDLNAIAINTAFEATYTDDNPLVLVAKADGYIYASYGDYTAVKKVIVESSAAETANDPIVTISGANGVERTVTINANNGSAGTAQTAYYTLDGSDPTNASTVYTTPITVSETTTVKAIAYCGEAASNIVTLEVEAGTSIILNQPVLTILDMVAIEGGFAPVFQVSIDNSNLIGSPAAKLEAIFDGNDVTDKLNAGSFSPDKDGLLTVTATANGYDNSTVSVNVYALYTKAYASTDYSTLTDEASVLSVLGDDWTKGDPTRWANWNKNNSTYVDQYLVYSNTSETEGNIYLDKDNVLRGPKAIQFMESFGFGRGVSGATKVFISNTGTPLDITLYRVINSKGLDENTYTYTFVQSNEEGYSEFDIPGCETLCQAIIYKPVLPTYTASFVNGAKWEKVYAYTWTGEVNNTWPGVEIEKTSTKTVNEVEYDVYTYSVEAETAPANIIFNNGNGGEGNQTADFVFENGKEYSYGLPEVVELNTYTATFTTNAGWEKVYAYVWSGEGEKKVLGDWPGTELTAVDGIYTVTIKAAEAPEKIIFNNGSGGEGNQTADLAFENGKAYDYTVSVSTDYTGYIVNAEFNPTADPIGWTPVISGEYRDYGMYQIGGEQSVRFAAPTADETHLNTEYAAGLECRWSTNYAAYAQTTAELPAGSYSLSYDVENVNGSTTSANYENRFTVTVGETVYTDESTEWMNGKSAWTGHAIKFTLTDAAPITISLGYGTGSNNIGSNNTPAIYVSHLKLSTYDPLADGRAELQETIDAAKALKTANRTNGLDEFNAAIMTAEAALTSTDSSEIAAAIKNLKDAMAAFIKANYYIDFAAGEYYVIDAESGLKMAAGHDWGTRGIVNEAGLDLTLTPYEASRTVTIDSRVSNGGNSHFLGSNLYMDSSEWGWALEYQGFGFYILNPNDGKYINLDANNNLVLSETPREWIIVSKDGVRAQLLDEMADATKDAPVDATGLLTAPNFNRNDARNAEAWIVSEDCTNKNLSGGNNLNNCAESYHSTFTIMQTVSNAPAGFYQLTAQGFYRQDEFEGEAPAAPVFFANEINGDVPALADGGPNSMSTASEAFTNGDYTIEPITFEVTSDGMMYVGITASTNTQWVIWDNFQLKYFGAETPTGISIVNVEKQSNSIYNLRGQKVEKAQKGLYIINGKLTVVK